MRRLLGGLAILAVAAGVQTAVAQTTRVDPPLQEVKAGGRIYTVDPYDVFTCFEIEHTERLAANGTGVEGEAVLQCFIRVGDEMTPIDEFTTSDGGVLEDVAIGQAIISKPQRPAEPLDGEVTGGG